MHPSTKAVLAFFKFDHLPPHLVSYSQPFHELAHRMARDLEGPELTYGLRKLLEAKDCMVRAKVATIPGHPYNTKPAHDAGHEAETVGG